MPSIRILAAAACATVAWGFPIPDKFKPMLTACEGHDKLSNCTATMQGACKTDEQGERSCAHQCGHADSAFRNKLKMIKKKMGFHFPHEDKHHGWPVHLGDCASKQDGEVCSIPRGGQCVPSGKCPIFRGEMVCRPTDAHPPKFIIDACRGKNVGDDCSMMVVMKGKCIKAKYLDDMFCKMGWPFAGAADEEEKESVVVV